MRVFTCKNVNVSEIKAATRIKSRTKASVPNGGTVEVVATAMRAVNPVRSGGPEAVIGIVDAAGIAGVAVKKVAPRIGTMNVSDVAIGILECTSR